MKRILFVITLILACGCSTYQGVGSDTWHQVRLQEIEEAYREGHLSEAEYLQLKNETDQIRQEYLLDGLYYRNTLRYRSRPYRSR